MSIDAMIREVEPVDVGVVLHLEPRYDRRVGHFQPQGVRRLTIINPTYIPAPGEVVWGGDSIVTIGHPHGVRYHRLGYSRLREWTPAAPPEAAP